MFDSFFNILKKCLVAFVFVVVGFTMTYVPQVPTSHVQEAEAFAGVGNFATEVTQWFNRILLGQSVIQETVTAGAASAQFTKDSVLDGIGWAITQRIVANMIRSTLDWVARGFEGSPAFVTDLRGFILEAADVEFGRVIEELGGIGSFICSPFRLDVQIALETRYMQGSGRNNYQSAPTCTLSGVINNIEGFISGIDPGEGFSDWLQITASPRQYTPYGAILSAEETARARIINAKGEEIKLLDFGDGFLSQKVCQSVSGFTGSDNCSIVKPGQVISEQINKSLELPADLAVTADEINEAIVSGLTTLVSNALNGSAGILGLSGNDGFGGYTAADDIVNIAANDATESVAASVESDDVIGEAIDIENRFVRAATNLRTEFAAFAADASNPVSEQDRAQDIVDEIDVEITLSSENIDALNVLSTEYDAASSADRANIIGEFYDLNLKTEASASRQISVWREAAEDLGINQ